MHGGNARWQRTVAVHDPTHLGGEAGVVDDAAVGGRVLHERAADVLVESEARVVTRDHGDAQPCGAGLNHGKGLRVHAVVDEELWLLARLIRVGGREG